MKIKTLILALLLVSAFGKAQSITKNQGFGVLTGSTYSTEFPFLLSPGVLYYFGSHQLELGLTFNPFNRYYQRSIGSSLSYKYYPNQRSTKFSLYFLTQVGYQQNDIYNYYQTTKQYLHGNAGYGFEVQGYAGLFMGTHLSFGLYSDRMVSELPTDAFHDCGFFTDWDYGVSFQFMLGYRW